MNLDFRTTVKGVIDSGFEGQDRRMGAGSLAVSLGVGGKYRELC